ncbi:serine/threonine protein kinase [Streptomyces sp. N2-109]|uniref:non-specific serine/threonine protein kinase n=1 Tax=Streptomyces gossypii TaxID=2883101 RepID=A0ABT2JVZ8_9ACTN|nr:serine/threonine-protein kinase [Streptomyces gossypii]MCT2592073.1 serine/threonine protein kinase [Streptomyces gossypii]
MVLDDRYELLSKLGGGGMGDVWEAFDRSMDRPVAVKLVRDDGNEELVSRLSREARAAGRLVHPHIVAVHDHNSTFVAGRPTEYVVMQLVPGRSLSELMATDGIPELRQALHWAAQVAHALEALHAPDVGIIHRDLKPANIMITHGLVKLVDFGIVRVIRTDAAPGTDLTAGRAIGTAQYMAPEQCTGAAVDGRTDLYALGCLLFAMLTGESLFPDELGHLPVMFRQVHETPRTPSSLRPGIQPALDVLVLQLLAKVPEERPDSATDVRRRLLALADAPPTPDAVPAGAEQASRVRTPTLWEAPAAEPTTEPDSGRRATGALAARLQRALRVAEEARQGYREDAAAVVLLEELISELTAELGAVSTDALLARQELANCLDRSGKLYQAVELRKELVDDLVGAHGPTSTQALEARAELVATLDREGSERDAMAHRRELTADLVHLYGGEDERALDARKQLADAARDSSAHGEAAAVWIGLIPDAVRLDGPESQLAGHAVQQLQQYIDDDQFGAGTRLWRDLLPDLTEAPAHPRTLAAREQLADADRLNSTMGDFAVARLWADLVPELGRVRGPDAPDTLDARRKLARAQSRCGDARQSAVLWHGLVADLTRVYGADHPETLGARGEQAQQARWAPSRADAVRLWGDLIPDLVRVYGMDSAEAFDARGRLAQSTERAGDARAAAEIMQELIRDLARTAGPDNRSTLIQCYWLSHVEGPADIRDAVAGELRKLYGAALTRKARAALRGKL